MKKFVEERFNLVFEKFKSLEQAREIQAKEYERRLNDLNGEAGRLKDIQQTYIPREVFDRSLQQQNEKFERVIKGLDDKIEILTAVNLKGQGAKELRSWIPLILTTIGLLLAYYFNR